MTAILSWCLSLLWNSTSLSESTFLTGSNSPFFRNYKLAWKLSMISSIFTILRIQSASSCGLISSTYLGLDSKDLRLLMWHILGLLTIRYFWILVWLDVWKISTKWTHMMVGFVYEWVFVKSGIAPCNSLFKESALSCHPGWVLAVWVWRLEVRIEAGSGCILMMKWHL
jgi:hypothetical protein